MTQKARVTSGTVLTVCCRLAFVLTRPLGATLGDFLDKPVAQGGMHLSRLYASLVLVVFIAICAKLIPQRPASGGGAAA